MSPLRIQNTFTGREEAFEPQDPGAVKMYVCGITPYDECHLGHARCYVVFDFIRRSLKWLGYHVRYVQNFTDIDDKIIARAKEKNMEPKALAEKYIAGYFGQMAALNILKADEYPRVTEHIPEIIALIEGLIKKEFAYPLDGDVYYSVRKFPAYGRLSKRSPDDMQAGARVEVDERKIDPLDFALWKAAKPGEPAWESPWGRGRPGWHIECSAMSLKAHQTSTLDIHGGGLDLIFPHHENEIAQSEASTGKPFVRTWIHNGFVTLNKEKMSKSKGNFFSLSVIFEKYEPRAVRYLLLNQHYRGPLDFSEDSLTSAVQGLARLDESQSRFQAALKNLPAKPVGEKMDTARYRERFKEALCHDFNSSEALAALHDLTGELSDRLAKGHLSSPELEDGLGLLKEGFEDVLGIQLRAGSNGLGDVSSLVEKREVARKDRNFQEADRLRNEILNLGFMLEDTPQGPRWWKKT